MVKTFSDLVGFRLDSILLSLHMYDYRVTKYLLY